MITARPEQVGISSVRLQRINDLAQGYIDRGQLPGTLTLVARRGHVVHCECRGMRNLETNQPVTEDTIFRIFSMSKPIASVAAMILFERGYFSLDTPVSEFIPAFQNTEVYEDGPPDNYTTVKPLREMNMGDLLRHTSGLTFDFLNRKTVGAIYQQARLTIFEDYSPDYLLADFVEKLAKMPLLFSPGTRWNYSTSTEVLGRVLEVISGKPLNDFLRGEIFQPLGMSDTDFFVPEHKQERFATLYVPDPEGKLMPCPILWHSRPQPPRMLRAGDGLVSTVGDYLRFCMMMSGRGSWDGQRLLSPKTVEYMTRNHLPGDLVSFGANPIRNITYPGIGFGLGMAVMADPIRANTLGSVGEYYWTGGGHTSFFIDPKEELFAIFMTQVFPPGQFTIDKQFKAAVYQSLVE